MSGPFAHLPELLQIKQEPVGELAILDASTQRRFSLGIYDEMRIADGHSLLASEFIRVAYRSVPPD